MIFTQPPMRGSRRRHNMKKLLLLSILSVFLSAGFASAQDLPVSKKSVEAASTYTVRFNVGGTIVNSGFINSCPNMSLRFYQSGTADVTLYAVDPRNTDPATGTLIIALTATTLVPTTFKPGRSAVRFKVITQETVAPGSFAVITCSNVEISGGSDVSTDDIWLAAEDLVVGTGVGTAEILGVGSEGNVLQVISGEVDWGTVGSASLPVTDSTSIAEGSGDATKEVRFEVDGLTTGNTRVLTVPDADITLGDHPIAAGDYASNSITRTEIDESLFSIQTDASACTANFDCDLTSNGEMCFQQDDHSFYICDGSGSPAWKQISIALDTLWAAKGDLVSATADDAAEVLTVGADDTMLMADASPSGGIKWATPATVRTALSLVPGTDVQAFDDELLVIAGLAETNGNVMSVASGAWTSAAQPVIDLTLATGLPVAGGGTGLASLTDGGVILGSAAGDVTVLAQATNGQLVIGSTGADPVLAVMTGSTNEIEIISTAGGIEVGIIAQPVIDLTAATGTIDATGSITLIRNVEIALDADMWVLDSGGAPPTEANFGTTFVRNILEFDNTADKDMAVRVSLPSSYDSSGGFNLFIDWSAPSVTTGNVCWCVENAGVADNEDADPTATRTTCNDDTVPGTADFIKRTTIALTPGDFAADDHALFNIYRDVDGTPTGCAEDDASEPIDFHQAVLSFQVSE